MHFSLEISGAETRSGRLVSCVVVCFVRNGAGRFASMVCKFKPSRPHPTAFAHFESGWIDELPMPLRAPSTWVLLTLMSESGVSSRVFLCLHRVFFCKQGRWAESTAATAALYSLTVSARYRPSAALCTCAQAGSPRVHVHQKLMVVHSVHLAYQRLSPSVIQLTQLCFRYVSSHSLVKISIF